MNNYDIIVIFCPPLSEYKTQPDDQSLCEPIDCPDCKEKMWFSIKKKEILDQANKLKKDVLLACYICFTKRLHNDPELREALRVHTKVDI